MNEKSAAEVLAPGLVQLAALARDPNITRAALEAGTSQPTLSRALRRWGAGSEWRWWSPTGGACG